MPPSQTADALGGHKKTFPRRAHSGHKSKRTAAYGSFVRSLTFRASAVAGKLRASPAALARTTLQSRGTCSHGGNGAGAQNGCGAPGSVEKRRRFPAHQSRTASCGVKRHRAATALEVKVPEPVRKPAPDARLSGRGWHERWPPPEKVKRPARQVSLRDFLVRPLAAPDPAPPDGVGTVAAPFGR